MGHGKEEPGMMGGTIRAGKRTSRTEEGSTRAEAGTMRHDEAASIHGLGPTCDDSLEGGGPVPPKTQ